MPDFMMLIVFLPIALIMVFMPYVTRRTESFGVSIPEEIYHSNTLKTMRKKYAWQTTILAICLIFIWLLLRRESLFPFVIPAFLIGSFLIYFIYHNRMKALKEKENWRESRSETISVDIGFRQQKISISHWWFLIPFAVSLLTLILSLVFYNQFPDKMPLHYKGTGQADRFAEKSYRSVLMLPMLQLFTSLLFLFINSIITKSKQQIDSANPEKSALQNKLFRRRWSLFNFWMGFAIVAMLGFLQLTNLVPMNHKIVMFVPLVVTGGIIVAAIILSFTTGQGGSRIKLDRKDNPDRAINRDDDQFWKLGVFYFNPNDPAIWVEKRFGVGWTVNFAHPLGWGSLVAILVIVFILQVFVK